MRKPIAIAVADLHLQMKPPPCRMEEPDWFEAMGRSLDALGILKNKHNVPILCAGDVFDKWNSPPELINFAFENIPDAMHAIPGQHDIPNHVMRHMDKSAFQSLINSQVLESLINTVFEADYYTPTMEYDVCVRGFPWGSEIKPPERDGNAGIDIAVIHKYIWNAQHAHPKVGQNEHVYYLEESLKGYDFAVFGDNHIPFTIMVGDCRVVNCGSFMTRRFKDDHRPRAWLLFDDQSVDRYYLDSKDDVITDMSPKVNAAIEASKMDRFDKMLEDLEGLGSDAMDFTEALNRVLVSYTKKVREAVLDMLEDD